VTRALEPHCLRRQFPNLCPNFPASILTTNSQESTPRNPAFARSPGESWLSKSWGSAAFLFAFRGPSATGRKANCVRRVGLHQSRMLVFLCFQNEPRYRRKHLSMTTKRVNIKHSLNHCVRKRTDSQQMFAKNYEYAHILCICLYTNTQTHTQMSVICDE